MTDLLAPLGGAGGTPRRWLVLEVLVWTAVGAALAADELLLTMTIGSFWADRIGQLLP